MSSPPQPAGTSSSPDLPGPAPPPTSSTLPAPFMMAMAAGAFGFPQAGPFPPHPRFLGTPPGMLPGHSPFVGFRTPPPGLSGHPAFAGYAAAAAAASTPKDMRGPPPPPPMFPSSTPTSATVKSERSSGYLGADELSSPEMTKVPSSSTTPTTSRKRPLQPQSMAAGGSSSDSTPTTTMTKTSQYKKIMKPLLERKRRARINKCLDELKEIMTAALTSQGENVSKLEKADILELTVRHLNKMQQARRMLISSSRNPLEEIHRFQAGFSSCAQEAAQFLMSSPGVDAECGQRLLAHLSKVGSSGAVSDPASGVPMPPSAGIPMPSTFQPMSMADSLRRRSSSASSSTPLHSSSAESMLLGLSSPSSRPASSMSSPKNPSPEPEKKKAKLTAVKKEDEEDEEECLDDQEHTEDDDEDEQDDESFVSGRFDVKVKPVKPAPVRPSAQGNSPSDPVWRPF